MMGDVGMDNVRSPLLDESNHDTSDSESTFTTKKVTIDEALEKIGSFGRFQIILQTVFMFFLITLGYQLVFSYFIGDDPGWKCNGNITGNNNTSHFCTGKKSGDEYHVTSKYFYERCKMSRNEWTYTTEKTYSYLTEFDLVCERAQLASLASAAVFIGGMFQIFTGALMDIYGRKMVLPASTLIVICVTISCSFVKSVWLLIGLRVVLGTAIWTCYAGGIMLLIEFIPPKSRAFSIGVYLIGNTISFLLSDLLAYYVRHWRVSNLYAAIPSMFTLVMILFIPQSPRWLLGNQQVSKAERVLENIARWNGKSTFGISLKQPVSAGKKTYTYLDLLRNWTVLKTTLVVSLLYATMALVYYEVALEANQLGGSIYKTFALSALGDVPSYFVAFYLCDRFGRKKTVIVSLLLSGITLASISLVPLNFSGRYSARVTLAMISKVFVNFGLLGIYCWGIEIFPTVLRSQGISLGSVLEKIGALCVPLLTSALNRVNPILIFIVIGLFAVITSGIGITVKDTNNEPTREGYDDMIEDS